mgnify:CR=1 FL=1
MWAPHNYRFQISAMWPMYELPYKQATLLDRKNSTRRSAFEINIILPYPYLQRRKLPGRWFVRIQKRQTALPHDSIRQPRRSLGRILKREVEKCRWGTPWIYNRRRFAPRRGRVYSRVLHKENDQQRRRPFTWERTRILPHVTKTPIGKSGYGSHPRPLYHEVWRDGDR